MRQSKNIRGIVKRLLLLAMVLVLSTTLVAATVDLISPDNVNLNSGDVTFDYYADLSAGIDDCSLKVNEAIVIIDPNITNSAPNTFVVANMPADSYTWSVICQNSQESEESEQASFIIDTQTPVVTLLNPDDEATVQTNVDFKFKTTDDYTSTMSCNLSIDGSVTRSNIQADDNVQITESISGIIPGDHDWDVICKDDAGNEGYSEVRDFTSQGQVEFSASLDKAQYTLGESATLTINAPDMTNSTIEVCPDGEGFVECFAAIEIEEATYPRIETLPFTNQSGEFIIDVFFAYEDLREVRRLNYEVLSTLVLSIQGTTTIKTEQETVLTGTAQGGIGSYSYEWTLHNGTTKTGRELRFRPTSAGTYTHTLKAIDEENNEISKPITITVQKAYDITVTVKSETNSPLEGVAVQIGSAEDTTSSEGTVIINAIEGNQDIFAFTTGYELYEGTLNVNADKSLEIVLAQSNDDPLTVSLGSPIKGNKKKPGEISLKFTANNAQDASCALYLKKGGEEYSNKQEIKVKSSVEHQFLQTLRDGNYRWKVECIDNGITAKSKEENFVIGTLEQEKEEPEFTGEFDRDSMLRDLENVMASYSTLGIKERELANQLGFDQQVKNAIKIVKRSTRDIHDLRFRTSLSEEEKEQQRKEVINAANNAYENVITNIEILESKSFVKYPNEKDIQMLTEIFAKYHEMEGDRKGLEKAINRLQGDIVVSTKTSILSLSKVDGSEKITTVVIREIKTEEVPPDAYIIEHIPKEVAESTDEIMVVGDYEVIEEDPVLRFPVQDKIIYYIEKEVDLEQLKGANTILVTDTFSSSLPTIAGSVSFGVPDVGLGDKKFLMMIIIILGAIYMVYGSGVWENVTKLVHGKHEDKEIHYMNVLINDALDNLEAGNYDKASLIYREVKLTFENVSTHVKNEVYKQIMDLVNKLDIAYSRELSKKMDEALTKGNRILAREYYERLQSTYKKLDEEYKKEIYSNVVEMAKRLKK